MCWYNSPTNANTNGIATFGPSPDNRENRSKKRKEDQPRFSLPENRTKGIDKIMAVED